MYESDDPRSKMNKGSGGGSSSAFGASTYARFYDSPPDETTDTAQTWYVRGQNFVLAYSKAEAGTVFDRENQPDEFVLILPDADSAAVVSANGETQEIDGFTVTMVPPGDSRIEIKKGGQVARLISTQSADMAALAANGEKYAGPHPQIPAFEPWPEPKDGFKIRSYSLNVPEEEGRFGKIFRCTTMMVNVFPPQDGPRDTSKLSPHYHDDFEQCSLAIGGAFEHHMRWPWIADKSEWRDDQHEVCGSPSAAVIPPKVIHTSAAVDEGTNLLIDIFSPPRKDFSDMPGWVLNADDYPKPQ